MTGSDTFTNMSASVSLLLISLLLQIHTCFSEVITEFNCAKDTTLPIRSASPSGSIVSPCYLDSYTSSTPSCVLNVGRCYILLPFLTDGTWLGLYNGDSNSALYTGDMLRFYYYDNGHNTLREWDFDEVAGRQFISSAAYIKDNIQYYLTFENQRTYSTVSPLYKFKVIYRYAHYIPLYRDISVRAKAKGYIVSHSGFDHGTTNSYYTAGITSGKYKLSELTAGKSVKIKFIYFKINHSPGVYWFLGGPCGDYLTISGVKGYKSNKLHFCGDEDPTTMYLDSLFPIGSDITFQFTTRIRLPSSNINSAGFLIEYQLIDEPCPPSVQNARVSLNTTKTIDGKAVYLITCDSGYRTMNNSLAQTYVCDSQQPPLPCIEITCRNLPEGLADVPYLNISLVSPGRPVVNSILTFSCNSTDYTLVGDIEALCSSDGVWVLENKPQCLPTSTTTTTTTTIATSTAGEKITECESMADFLQDTNVIISEPTGGRPVVDSVITFSCKSNYILTGDSQATCSPGGIWKAENAPGCTPDNTDTGTLTLAPLTTTVSDSGETSSLQNKDTAMYAGIAAGAAVVLMVIVVVAIVLIRKKKNRDRKLDKLDAPRGMEDIPLNFQPDNNANGGGKGGGGDKDGVVYSLADEYGSGINGGAQYAEVAGPTGGNVYDMAGPTGGNVYDMADPVEEEEYANSATIRRELEKPEGGDTYADITPVTKRKMVPNTTVEVELLDNDLYGT